jgi:hypothetical protein
MADLTQTIGLGLLAAPVAGAAASAAGKAWGNLVTAAVCALWIGVVLFGTGGFSGSVFPITAAILGGVALTELVLASELHARQVADRSDVAIRAVSALLALAVPVIVIVFAMLLFSAWISSL